MREMNVVMSCVRISDVERRNFCTLEYLIAQYLVEATESILNLRDLLMPKRGKESQQLI